MSEIILFNQSVLEILHKPDGERAAIKAAVFDFDGTLSTLRFGWENVMEPFMLEMIAWDKPVTEDLRCMVREYVDQSTGIQTIYQMQWLTEMVLQFGNNPNASEDPWYYKAEYNKRLMKIVNQRIDEVMTGNKQAIDYLMAGSEEFLKALKGKGISIYGASGTDHPDVIREADFLGLFKYFDELAGAPIGMVNCSKEAVLKKLIDEKGLSGDEVAVIGDGRVEIALGREIGAVTLGLASDEEKRFGINKVKRNRLVNAGAHAIAGDFMNLSGIFKLFNI